MKKIYKTNNNILCENFFSLVNCKNKWKFLM